MTYQINLQQLTKLNKLVGEPEFVYDPTELLVLGLGKTCGKTHFIRLHAQKALLAYHRENLALKRELYELRKYLHESN